MNSLLAAVKVVDEAAKEPGPFWWLPLVAAAVIGWMLRAAKDYHEIRKNRHAIRELVSKQLIQRNECRHIWDEAHQELKRHLSALMPLVDQPSEATEELQSVRQQVCEALTDVISKYVSLFEFTCHVYKDDKKRMASETDSAVCELRRWSRCVQAVNHPRILEALDRSPLAISKHTLSPLRRLAEKLPVPDSMRKQFCEEILAVVAAGL
ncbi:MAG: hypothetical protein HQ567_15470 [Candidatus Nealsonbacteria bacterium]|nr:hypothetical protein [Candidatus Nealsonbacteria bacterium]